MKAEEKEAGGRLEAHTEWMVINQEAGQCCWQRTFHRLPALRSSSELWLSPEPDVVLWTKPEKSQLWGNFTCVHFALVPAAPSMGLHHGQQRDVLPRWQPVRRKAKLHEIIWMAFSVKARTNCCVKGNCVLINSSYNMKSQGFVYCSALLLRYYCNIWPWQNVFIWATSFLEIFGSVWKMVWLLSYQFLCKVQLLDWAVS